MEDMVQKVLWGLQVIRALKETKDAVALEVRLLMLCTNKLPLTLKLGQSCIHFKLIYIFFYFQDLQGLLGSMDLTA